ncbi:glycosyltransferase [Paenibacillus glufosinatiresistens]|uniref:glycosyltransferase n=1 Tax=Paenibacillus glufosinatiresistens TaxID=3070657 RepID=UPI00286DE958|nr:glycosyltransferase [Paenibacillus sp. YX.27]
MSPAVSVVVPVYNAASRLSACVESLLGQTLGECEFIFVNDGSSDGSGSILDAYQSRDPRVRVIHQENRGVSEARNAGIQACSGSYVGFVDADDTVEADMFEQLYRTAAAESCDVVICNYESETGVHKQITRYPFPSGRVLLREELDREILPYYISDEDCNSVCNKLFLRSMIEKHSLRFPQGVDLGEDGIFNVRFLLKAERAFYLDYTGYHYLDNPGSATRNIAGKDYFRKALERFEAPLPEGFEARVGGTDIRRLRSVRFIRTAASLVHMYMEPARDMSLRRRMAYLRKMLNHPGLRTAFPDYYKEEYPSLGTYQRAVIDAMSRRRLGRLYLLTAYSRIRNR